MTTSTWTTLAACADRFDLPWTTDTADVTPWQALTMRTVCDSCPVTLDCLAAVDDLGVTGGFWVGFDRDPHAVQLVLPAEWMQAGVA